MIRFPELVIGGVLIAPFVTYSILAFVVMLLLRPMLRLLRFEQVVHNPPLVLVSLYFIVLAVFVLV